MLVFHPSGAAETHELSRTLGAAQDANGYLAVLILTEYMSITFNYPLIEKEETRANQGYRQNHW